MFNIEIDVDGVLANMDGSYGAYVKDIIPNFTEDTHILNWNIPEVEKEYPEAFKRIVSLFTNPEFIETVPRYDGIEEGMQLLSSVIKPIKGNIIIHTHMPDSECEKKRREWLELLKEDTGVDFDVDISSGKLKNMRTDSLILIEDNVRNCNVSNAKYKILIRRGHNRSFGIEDLGACKQGYVVGSFLDAVRLIQENIEGNRWEFQ